MRVLGLETSCDETSASVVEDGTRVLSNVIASQVELHARFGGVVPEVASRQHLLEIIPTVHQALEQAQVKLEQLDGVAVTRGPGLAGSLLVGLNLGKALAFAHRLPLVGVNHLEGHIYANWLEHPQLAEGDVFPMLCLLVSGGHSDLVFMQGHGSYQMLGRTRDDAAGEAFDKVGRMLGLGYPGGPAIEKLAEKSQEPYRFPRAWLKETFDFSFSGLKTAVLHAVRALGVEGGKGADEETIANMAAGFQQAVVEVLVAKTADAAVAYKAKYVLIAGGVAANKHLRGEISRRSPVPVLFPRPLWCTDNAAMIAACGCYRLRSGMLHGLDLDVAPGLKLGDDLP